MPDATYATLLEKVLAEKTVVEAMVDDNGKPDHERIAARADEFHASLSPTERQLLQVVLSEDLGFSEEVMTDANAIRELMLKNIRNVNDDVIAERLNLPVKSVAILKLWLREHALAPGVGEDLSGQDMFAAGAILGLMSGFQWAEISRG